MNVRDEGIDKIIDSNGTVNINNQEFYIQRNPSGSCDGCYFHDKRCASKALTICCSNGGNVLKLKEDGRENSIGYRP